MNLFSTRAPWPFGRRREEADRGTVATVAVGATYARLNSRQVVETARVVSVEEHEGGVAHVRYSCRLQCDNRVFEDGYRTLALPTFLERFRPLRPAPAESRRSH